MDAWDRLRTPKSTPWSTPIATEPPGYALLHRLTHTFELDTRSEGPLKFATEAEAMKFATSPFFMSAPVVVPYPCYWAVVRTSPSRAGERYHRYEPAEFFRDYEDALRHLQQGRQRRSSAGDLLLPCTSPVRTQAEAEVEEIIGPRRARADAKAAKQREAPTAPPTAFWKRLQPEGDPE
jgi:hypothetical protein